MFDAEDRVCLPGHMDVLLVGPVRSKQIAGLLPQPITCRMLKAAARQSCPQKRWVRPRKSADSRGGQAALKAVLIGFKGRLVLQIC